MNNTAGIRDAMGKLVCPCRQGHRWNTGVGSLRRTVVRGLVVLSALLLSTFPAKAVEAQKKGDPAVRTQVEGSVQKIHDGINAYRASQGLKPLVLNPFISKIAAEHSGRMATGKVEFGHQGFEKRSKTIQEQVKSRSIAENVGVSAGKADPENEVMKGWLQSPGHLKNIEGDFDLTGIGVAKKGDDRYYFTQIFLKKRR